ncbi:MAG: hypothetical protein AAGB25_05435 [Pseudomonadota bacterium]
MERHLNAAAVSILAAFSMATAAHAQSDATSDGPIMIPERVVGPQTPLEGVRISKPGALVLASFDTNGDMQITPEERVAGAVRAFATADTDGSGQLSGFEQQDWAKAAGSPDGPLANALLFDANLDRTVTPDEFAEGLERLAKTYANPETGVVAFADLVATPDNRGRRGEGGPDGGQRPRNGDRPNRQPGG